MEQSLKIGNYEVLSTGSVLIPKDEYAEFSFDTLNFRIIFREEKDDEGKATNPMVVEVRSRTSLVVKMHRTGLLYFSETIRPTRSMEPARSET